MKKSLAFLTIATLLVAASGCGCCRGMFGKSAPLTSPVYSQCAPRCAPTCPPMCSTTPSYSTNDCGCGSSSVTYGYPSSGHAPMSSEMTYESTPMTVPTGSGTFGQ